MNAAAGVATGVDGADLSESTFVQEPTLPRASMRGAQLRKVFLHGADLTGADLSQANLDGAELGYSRLGGANLGGAKARKPRSLQDHRPHDPRVGSGSPLNPGPDAREPYHAQSCGDVRLRPL